MQELPNEIFYQIFSHLEAKDMGNLCCAGKFLKEILLPYLKKYQYLPNFKALHACQSLFEDFFECLFKFPYQLYFQRSLHFDKYFYVPKEDLSKFEVDYANKLKFFDQLKNLKTLTVVNMKSDNKPHHFQIIIPRYIK